MDTDLGSDCDDMMAIAYLVYAQRKLGISIGAITYSNGCEYGIAAMQAVFDELNEVLPPLGTPAGEVGAYDHYCKILIEKHPIKVKPAEDSVRVMRRTLMKCESAIICGVGAFTNIAALLKSEADDISPLSGIELVKSKCVKIVSMAGIFEKGTERTEWNVHLDIPAAATVCNSCPVPLVFLPSETGMNIITGASIMEKYPSSLLAVSFFNFPSVKELGGRHSWDPVTAMYCVEGCKNFLTETEKGIISVDEKGKTSFTPCDNGNHSVLYVKSKDGFTEAECKAEIAKYLDDCSIELYKEITND